MFSLGDFTCSAQLSQALVGPFASLFSHFTFRLNVLDILDLDSARFELDDLGTWIQGRTRGSPARTFQLGVSSPTGYVI